MKKLILFLIASVGAFAQVPTITVSPNVLQEGQSATATCTANCTGITWKVNTIAGGNTSLGTISGNNTSATYTAPSVVLANANWGGCPNGFSDSIWNVPISAMSMISNWNGDPYINDAWYHTYENSRMSGLALVDVEMQNLATNATPTINVQGLTGINIAYHNLPNLQYPYAYREGGLYDFSQNDHHTLVVNTSTCQLYEWYNEHSQPAASAIQACANPSGGNCFKGSSAAWQTPETSTASYTRNGGTGAGGNMISPYVDDMAEVLAAVNDGVPIKHAVYLRPPSQASSGDANLEWPATFGNGFCAAKDVVGVALGSGGSGYSAATTVTFVGGLRPGASAPTWKANITGGVIQSITFVSAGTSSSDGSGEMYVSTPTISITDTGGGSGATATATIDYPCFPYGARLALDQTYLTNHTGAGCPAGSNCLTGAGLAVATQIANYGGVVNDNCCGGTGFQMDGSSDLEQNASIISSIRSALSHLTFSNMHVYDTTPLGKSTASGADHTTGFNAGVVADNNAGYIPDGVAWITATNASGQSLSTKISLQPPTIGTPDTEISILAGDYSLSKGTNGGYQIPYWINGTSQTAVTWSCSTCAANGSTITQAGVYTPPATETTTGTQDVVKVTLNADPNCYAAVYFDILPNSGNYVPNTIRIDSGASSNSVDGNGHAWIGNAGIYTAQQNAINETWGNYVTPSGMPANAERSIYSSELNSSNSNDLYYKFIVPNGQYKVRVLSGWDNEGGAKLSDSSANHYPLIVAGGDNGSGGIQGLHWNMMLHAAKPYARMSNSDFYFGELVSNNVITAAVIGDYVDQYPSDGGWSGCTNSCIQGAIMSGLDIEPDSSTAPHWKLLCTNGIPPSLPTNITALTDAPTIAAGGELLLYIQDYYTGIYDPVFSIVSGPGSITATTVSLRAGQAMPAAIFTASAVTETANRQVIVKATSQSNPNISATLAITVTQPSGTANYFK